MFTKEQFKDACSKLPVTTEYLAHFLTRRAFFTLQKMLNCVASHLLSSLNILL